MMLIALAGSQRSPHSIYEAAEIDRASRWPVFRHVTLPMRAAARARGAVPRHRRAQAVRPRDGDQRPERRRDPDPLDAALPGRPFARKSAWGAPGPTVLVIVLALATVFTRYMEPRKTQEAT
ncbi:MAG: sugar ABC transporter permease [Planctomycetes bacterium]|nr:sugar ABC transporter permease [Planctomycetota bacterium]